MHNKSYSVEGLEDATHEKIQEFINFLTDQERIRGDNMEKNTNHFSYRIASNVIRLIKDGYVQNVNGALNYMLAKTGIAFDDWDDIQATAWMDVSKRIRKFNGGHIETYNCQRTFTILMETKQAEVCEGKSGLSFAKADLLFDIYKKNGRFPGISLFEHTNPIRIYKEGAGEKRDIWYEAINGLSGMVARPEHTVYKDIAVQTGYVYHQDSRHGWLEVPVRELQRMGLHDRITPCSYLHQGKAYLEEDVDMGTFLDIRNLLPRPFDIQNTYMEGSCFIREYPHYRPENIMPEKPARKNTRSKEAGWER
jgi:hypothetical protein